MTKIEMATVVVSSFINIYKIVTKWTATSLSEKYNKFSNKNEFT